MISRISLIYIITGDSLHILVLTDEIYPDAIGGVAKSLYNECTALVRRGNEVTVIVRGIDRTLALEDTIEGVRIVRLFGPARSSLFYYLYVFSTVINFIRWLRRSTSRFDVIYVHNPLLILSVQLSGLHRVAPIAYTFHAPMYEEIHISVSAGKYGLLNPIAWLGGWIIRLVEARVLRLADVVFPRSQFSYANLHQLCPEASIPEPLIPLGVNTQVYAPYEHEDARKALGLPQDIPILLTVRRLAHRMGLQNLIAAMKTVREKHPDALLLIAGKGPLLETLKQQISSLRLQDAIRLLGLISESDLILYLGAADLFVLPTEFLEGFGLATLEALSSARPVVGTPNGATPELLAPIDGSLLTRDASAQALSDALGYWLDRRESLPALGVRCRGEVEAHYDIDKVAEQLEQRFQTLISSKQSG